MIGAAAFRRFVPVLLFLGLAGCADGSGLSLGKGADQTGAGKSNDAVGERTLDAMRTAAREARQKGDFLAAARQYARLAAQRPDAPRPAIGAVRMLRYAGRTQEAVRMGEEALDRFPEKPAVRLALARAHVADDRPRAALRHLDKLAASRDRKAGWAVAATRGLALDLLNEHDKAQAAYKAALEQNPGNSEVLNNLGLSQALSGDLEKGRATLRRALGHAGARDTQIRQNLALLAALAGDRRAAERYSPNGLPGEARAHNRDLYRKLARVHSAPGDARRGPGNGPAEGEAASRARREPAAGDAVQPGGAAAATDGGGGADATPKPAPVPRVRPGRTEPAPGPILPPLTLTP